MKNIFLIVLLFSLSLLSQTQQLGSSKVVIGTKTATDKTLEFNINQGAANPKIKANASTQKIQFAQDGVNYKDIGSGSGSGGSGINLLTEGGFESGIAIGWSSTGGTFSAVTSGTNLLYQTTSATFQASATGQFFESSLITVPEQLGGLDCLAKISYKGGDANLFLTVVNSSNVNITNGITAALSASTFRRDVSLYFQCPAASTQFKIRVQSTAASALTAFDEAHVGGTDFKAANGLTSEINYTPIYTGFGTPTAVDIKYSRVGKKLKILGRFALGTSTAVTASISLPNSWTVSSKYTSSKIFGSGYRLVATAATKNYSIIASPNDTTLKISASGDTQTPNPITPILGTDIGSSGQEFSFNAEMEINEFTESELVVNSKCSTDIACENTFSASISSTGVVGSENLDWINGNCTNPLTGQIVCTYNSGVFSGGIPNCSIQQVGANVFSVVESATASTIQWSTYNTSNVRTAAATYITCQKSGPDFKAKQSIQGFLSSTITSGGNNRRVEDARMAGCATSPCTIATTSSSWLTSITRTATGRYNINIAAGTFSDVPNCQYMNISSGSGRLFPSGSCASSTLCTMNFDSQVPAATDADASIVCYGTR